MKQMNSMQTKERSSNIELFRILLMLLLVASHYVHNSGLLDKSGQHMYIE